MSARDIDEILEIIWMEREKGEDSDLCVVQEEIIHERLQDMLPEMEKTGLLTITDGRIKLTAQGDTAASQLIRRHRLAERLLVDVLETGRDELEDSACQFEHILSEQVTDAICTLLGHPKECPHGLPVPPGRCCQKAREVVESVVTTLEKVAVGETVTVAYILTRNHPRMHKLMSFGISPGVKIKLHQNSPSYIIQVEETQVALEQEVIKDIYVRR